MWLLLKLLEPLKRVETTSQILALGNITQENVQENCTNQIMGFSMSYRRLISSHGPTGPAKSQRSHYLSAQN